MLQSSSSIFVSRIELRCLTSNFDMRSLLLATCLLLAVSTIQGDLIDVYLEKSKDQVLKCGKENGLTEQTPRQIYDKDTKMGADKASCVQACVMKSIGAMKDSKVNLEKINEIIKSVHADEPEKIKDSTKKAAACADKVKDMSDECKTAFSYVQCYLNK